LTASSVCWRSPRSAALVVETMLSGGLSGSVAEVATNVAYPLGDLVLVSAVTLVLALNGWRLERTRQLPGLSCLYADSRSPDPRRARSLTFFPKAVYDDALSRGLSGAVLRQRRP
jgi:hypothetical protein